MADRVLLVVAYDNSFSVHEPVAGALNLVGSDALFGRNWCEHATALRPTYLCTVSSPLGCLN